MGRVLIDENFLIANKGNKQKIKRGKKTCESVCENEKDIHR